VMELLGERSWWIPAWLDRVLPRISIEGQGFFDDPAALVPAAEPEAEPIPALQTNAVTDQRSGAPAGSVTAPDQGVTMSVIVMLRIKAEAKRLQEVIDSDETRWQAINSRAKEL